MRLRRFWFSLLSQNYDEPFHIAAGMEWLDKGIYRYEAQHPPWPGLRTHQVLILPAYGHTRLNPAGTKAMPSSTRTTHIGAILRSPGSVHGLFVVLGCITILLWARRWFSESASLLAILLFTSVPPVLAVAGQATTDIACTATLLLRFMNSCAGLNSLI